MVRKKAIIDKKHCVACGACLRECPKNAIKLHKGLFADVDLQNCVGCGKCEKTCPASVIDLVESTSITTTVEFESEEMVI